MLEETMLHVESIILAIPCWGGWCLCIWNLL